ncbi:hypothetical protein B0H19DRAFT_1149350 [Mycena capillaripes]|nr:hypothetical protein B0H19DRAFT_1149350 [Mycena capillaripes]
MIDHPNTLPSHSGRIVLVRPQEQDDAAVSVLRCHPETRRYLGFLPEHLSVEDARAQRLVRAADKTRLSFNIHLSAPLSASSESAKFVGTAGISHINTEFKSCEIGILISPDAVRGRRMGVPALVVVAIIAVVVAAFFFYTLRPSSPVWAVGQPLQSQQQQV